MVEVSTGNFLKLEVGDSIIDKFGVKCKVTHILEPNHERILARIMAIDPVGQEIEILFHDFLGPVDEHIQPFMRFSDPESKIIKA